MVILLTLEESEDEIISGFPEYIVLTSNIPSNIYYTLDGSEPDESSEIFVEKLYRISQVKSFVLTGMAEREISTPLFSISPAFTCASSKPVALEIFAGTSKSLLFDL